MARIIGNALYKKITSADSDEAKKTTDGYTDLYNIIQEIEDCPAILFNARRKFVRKVNALVVADNNLTKTGDKIVLFIFHDCVEIAKVFRLLYPTRFKMWLFFRLFLGAFLTIGFKDNRFPKVVTDWKPGRMFI